MMMNIASLSIFAVLLHTACSETEPMAPNNEIPIVKKESSYTVLMEEDLPYSNGLAYHISNNTQLRIPLKLDVYYPNNNSMNRTLYMFIKGGGFQCGKKTKPEIVNMAN